MTTPRFVTLLAAIALAACASSRSQPAPQSGFAGPLYYEEAGAGNAVVLIHGGFGDRRMWDPQFDALARRFRVIRYDQRGFGRTAAADSAYSPVRDLAGLLDHLGIQRAHLVGNSMGGALALDFALLHPQRVGRLVVVASGANGYPYTDQDVESVVAVFRLAQQQGVDSAAHLWLQHPMIGVSSRQPRSASLVRQMVRDNRGIFAMRFWPTERMAPVAYERLGELQMPVLFVIGQKDTPLVQRVSEATAARVAGSRIYRMPGGDHLPQLVEPAAFTARITEFLERD